MSNSPLVSYTKITPNRTSPRNAKIDTITIHCVVGQSSVESLGNWFYQTSTQASCNYAVGVDGRIGMYVEEKDRAWCSGGKDASGNPIRVNGISGADNDHRAVTIEVASDATDPYAVKDIVYASLIKLIADICKRNNIKKLLWSGDKKLVGQITKQNMTVHRWFANKACPGNYLYERHGDIAKQVNALLGEVTPTPSPADTSEPTATVMYRVRKTWSDSTTQKGAFTSLTNAKTCADENTGYKVFDPNGAVVYDPTMTTSDPTTTVDSSKYTKITGKSLAVVEQMVEYIKSKNPKVEQSVLDMIPLYISEGASEGIRGDIAFAQSCLETGNFAFSGSAVTLDQNNFCGLGVTSNGMKGNSFDTPQLGIRAQIQHLKAYANTDALKEGLIDPRFNYVTRGSAEYVEWLGIQENPQKLGWASGADYGKKILNILAAILSKEVAKVPTESDLAKKWIVDSGIFKGDSNGDMLWSNQMTREQFAIALYRFYNLTNKKEDK